MRAPSVSRDNRVPRFCLPSHYAHEPILCKIPLRRAGFGILRASLSIDTMVARPSPTPCPLTPPVHCQGRMMGGSTTRSLKPVSTRCYAIPASDTSAWFNFIHPMAALLEYGMAGTGTLVYPLGFGRPHPIETAPPAGRACRRFHIRSARRAGRKRTGCERVLTAQAAPLMAATTSPIRRQF
jgi:hypothetical protein